MNRTSFQAQNIAMFTFHHGFWLYFVSRGHYQVWQFVLGSMLPDYVYFIMLGIMVGEGRIGLSEIPNLDPLRFGGLVVMYPWVVISDLVLHSVVWWAVAFVAVLLPMLRTYQAFVTGWGTHLLVDTFTHGAEANYYLYPLSSDRVHGFVSYWEPAYFAREYNIVHTALLVWAISYLLVRWLRKKLLR